MVAKYLPSSAYFASGGGPVTSQLWDDLQAIGFNNISGPNDSQKATGLFITEPGKPEQQISPPGTAPKQLYDTSSEITIVIGAMNFAGDSAGADTRNKGKPSGK